MMERRQILELWHGRQQPAVMVTLTCATGSSYRRPGAHVLLLADGRHAGTISGGCLEAEVARKAFWMTRNGAVMQRYSTLFDDTAEIPFGLGCGGEIDILLEPADTPECAALIAAMQSSLRGEQHTAITMLPIGEQKLQRVIRNAAGEIIFASASLTSEAAEALAATSRGEDIFAEELNPPQRLIICGAGDDAQPLATLAAQIGWDVLVADGRAQLATSERFPKVQIVPLDETQNIAPLALRETDAIVLMTHSYQQDRALLAQLLPLAPRYLGVLGARQRTSLLVSEVAAQLNWSISDCAIRLHAPTGLDLGGDAPESIALAILAEAHALCFARNAASRRITAGEMLEHLHNATRAPAICALDTVSNDPSSRANPEQTKRGEGAAEGPASLPVKAAALKGK